MVLVFCLRAYKAPVDAEQLREYFLFFPRSAPATFMSATIAQLTLCD